jgi:ferredoxin-nitrite reductase
VALPVGQITPKQMLRVAELDLYGSGEARRRFGKNFIIPNVANAYVGTVQKAFASCGLERTNTLAQWTGLHGQLLQMPRPTQRTPWHWLITSEKTIKLKPSTFICGRLIRAQHYMETLVYLRQSRAEALSFIGGSFGSNQAVGRQVFNGISSRKLKPTLEKMLKGMPSSGSRRGPFKVHSTAVKHPAGHFLKRRMTARP